MFELLPLVLSFLGGLTLVLLSAVFAYWVLNGVAYLLYNSSKAIYNNLLLRYRMGSLKHYMAILVEHGRSGVLKEVEKAKRETLQQQEYSTNKEMYH